MKSFVSVFVVGLLTQQVLGDSQLVARASNTFANKLYQKLAQKPGNVLVCPISIHIALGLVHQGAGGSTATELATVLGLGGNNANIKESYKSLLTGIKDNTLKIATKLYPAIGYKLNQQYVADAQNYFLSEVEGIDFGNADAAADKINKYVEEKTNNKIHDLISADSISDLTRLVVINAVHFQATWKNTFSQTYNDFFKISPEEKVETTMMTQTDYFGYKEDPALGAKILKMDYTEGGYSMVFVLPNETFGLAAVEAKLVNTPLGSLLNGLTEQKVEVTIPKFKLEQTLELKDVLTALGIKEMFSSRADLHNVAGGDNLYVSDVIQKTFINVHENGTEAAAATGVLEVLSADFDEPFKFFAGWPFHFYLIKKPDLVLFEGRLAELKANIPTPSKPAKFDFEDKIYFAEDAQDSFNKKGSMNQNLSPQLNNANANQGVPPTKISTEHPQNSVLKNSSTQQFNRGEFLGPTPTDKYSPTPQVNKQNPFLEQFGKQPTQPQSFGAQYPTGGSIGPVTNKQNTNPEVQKQNPFLEQFGKQPTQQSFGSQQPGQTQSFWAQQQNQPQPAQQPYSAPQQNQPQPAQQPYNAQQQNQPQPAQQPYSAPQINQPKPFSMQQPKEPYPFEIPQPMYNPWLQQQIPTAQPPQPNQYRYRYQYRY